jgi:hypothetical protein
MIGGRLSRRYAYRCEGQGPQRRGCGNVVSYSRLETMVIVTMMIRNDKPYRTREWVEGTNWDSEIADTLQSLQALDRELVKLGIDEYNRRHAELITQYADYQWKNDNEAIAGDWEYTDALNDDGTVKTEGRHFFELDRDGRRAFLMDYDIRAERSGKSDGDIRLVIDGEEIKLNPRMMALLDIVGSEVAGEMLDSQIPNAAEWQALLAGLAVPGSSPAELEVIVREATMGKEE